MNSKKPLQDIDLDSNMELFAGLNRQSSEVEWANQMKRALEPAFRDSAMQQEIDDGLMNLNLKNMGNDLFKRASKPQTKEAESFARVFNYAKFNNSPTNFPSLSRFNSIINDELALEKRSSMVEEKVVDITINKLSELTNENLLHMPTLEKTNSILDGYNLPSMTRLKSNESFGILFTRNCSAYHISEQAHSAIQIPCRNADFPHFGNLLDFLKKHFKGRKVDEKDLTFHNHEMDVLKSIISRKYKGKINIDVKSFFLKDKLSEIEKLESFKRPEENYKFVFKRCIKYLKDRLKAFEGKQLKKKEFDSYFYEYYFSEACKLYNFTIDQVQNPCNSKGVKTKLKTVNTEYISHMIKSEKFTKDFNDYMYGNLQIDYELTIDSKIDALVRRWDDLFNKHEEKPKALEEIIEYVLKNKKCKLPWTGKEIADAIRCVKITFEECSISKHNTNK